MKEIIAISGAGGVLCSTMAKFLAGKGYRIALLDLNEGAMKPVVEEIEKAGGEALAVQCSVLDKESLQRAKATINEKLGKVKILINGAGGNSPKGNTFSEVFNAEDLDDDTKATFFDLDAGAVDNVFKLNFLGTFLTTQVFASDLLGGGNIVNISSMNAFRPLTKIPAYSGAKAAVSNFTQWLAVHFAGAGIRVNALAPGFFVTNQNRNMLFNPDGSPTARTNKILAHTPMGRFGEPEELLGTLAWLLDDSASGFVTGIVVPIDGGFSAYSGV